MNLEKITGYSPLGHGPSSSWDTHAAPLVFSPLHNHADEAEAVRAVRCCSEGNLSKSLFVETRSRETFISSNREQTDDTNVPHPGVHTHISL